MYVLPKPKNMREKEGCCDLTRGLSLAGDDHGLQTEIKRLPLNISSLGLPLLLCITKNPPAIVPGDNPHANMLSVQAYRLEVSPSRITLEAMGQEGLRYGLATLRQLVRQAKGALPCMEIEDYPDIPYRGVMVDVSRGKIPTQKTLMELIDLLSDYKYNVLQLYWEDCYRVPAHPLIGTLNGFYTREEISLVDRYCADRGIELQPNIQTFSHMHGLLRLPGYQNLSENDNLFTLAPGKEGVYLLLDEILHEVLPWFSSKTVHINMDEAYDLGTGYSAEAVSRFGKTAVFKEHLERVCAIVRACGAEKIFIWGDSIQSHPELLAQLPDDVVCVDWNYNAMESFPSLRSYRGQEKAFWAAPGTSSWNAVFPRVQNACRNIRDYTREACEMGAEGILVTHWGDYGHHQPFSFSFYGFVFGAEQAFNGGRTDIADFEDAAAVLFFASQTQREGFRILMEANELPSLQVGFKTQTIYALFDDLLKGMTLVGDKTYPAIPEGTFAVLLGLGDSAVKVLESAVDDTRFTQELLLAARMTRHIGRKGLLSYEIIKAFRERRIDESGILSWIYRLKLLYRDFSLLRETFSALWAEEALLTGREGALYLFDKAGTRYDEAVRWLAVQRRRLLAGKKPDTDLESYTAADGYGTLWTGDCMNMWDRAYPWR